jgi:hypothetical protein
MAPNTLWLWLWLSIRVLSAKHTFAFSLFRNRNKRRVENSMMESSVDLVTQYRQISNRAIHTVHWPASEDFCKFLEYTDGVYRAPTFSDGQGPFALVSLISETDNAAALPLITACLAQFDSFVEDLRAISSQPMHNIIPANVPHICIAVFHEHPSLLTEDQQVHWRPVDDATMQLLAADLSATVQQHAADPIWLRLDSLMLTPDGAMIAGFIDSHEDGRYHRMKTACVETARARLQSTLTSRPKQLIHVTLGRVLSLGGDDLDKQQQVQELVRSYNQERLPAFVSSCKDWATWQLQQVSLLRNSVWLCEENVIYKTWDLTKHSGHAIKHESE